MRKDLHSDSWNPQKPGLVAQTCKPSDGEIGRETDRSLEAYGWVSLAYILKFQASGRPVSNKRWNAPEDR